MIKSLLILVLIAALCAIAAATRPSEASFEAFARTNVEKPSGNVLARLINDATFAGFIKRCQYENRFLWATETVDGQPTYTGAFGHWFGGGQANAKS